MVEAPRRWWGLPGAVVSGLVFRSGVLSQRREAGCVGESSVFVPRGVAGWSPRWGRGIGFFERALSLFAARRHRVQGGAASAWQEAEMRCPMLDNSRGSVEGRW